MMNLWPLAGLFRNWLRAGEMRTGSLKSQRLNYERGANEFGELPWVKYLDIVDVSELITASGRPGRSES